MWVTQREITEAYLNGEDVLRKYHFRRTLCISIMAPFFIVAVLAMLYALKTAAGINILPDQHLSDLLQGLV